MSLLSTIQRYMNANATVVHQRRFRAANRNGFDTINAELKLTIWPKTLSWSMKNRGERLEDLFGYAIADVTYDIKPGDKLNDYPDPGDELEVASVNRFNDGTNPLPHLGGVLRRYSHQG